MEKIIRFSLRYKAAVLLFTAIIVFGGIWSALNLPVGAVPDITNNQIQVITTSTSLSAEDVEKLITAPIELEMGNIQGVKEIRSVSKFGLSVVTIVFDDAIGTYLPRQLVAEKLVTAAASIPDHYGKPFMGPISTGLGEIYQYTLDVKPEFKDQYSTMELRTIHDWVVRRQLAGIPGVVEVNTWGGFLKQYEVAVDPERLRGLNISLADVMRSLESNNSIQGGAYIEHAGNTYFVRGEGRMNSVQDIENTMVVRRGGSSVLIRDVGEVRYGHAPRFGAITANGEGEKILGQVMMLKGANSLAVIDAVKDRVQAVQATLPEGVFIKPILDRSDLISRTTSTIETNLIEGCLIVVFVVILLLGNWRSGLIIGSLIPLSLLFALILMKIGGVDANLMSLGAIDFGIIIDGAVIIVEFLAFRIGASYQALQSLPAEEQKAMRSEIIASSTSKMMKSAFFGQLIILIVFIPILTMTGVEGKMFIPMALTFSFALIGAMVLSMTYVPVVSELFLKGGKEKSQISSFIFLRLEALYTPVLTWALNNGKATLGFALAILTAGFMIFSTLGGEFVPTLDEGDYVIQPVLPTGTSLAETVRITTLIEKELTSKFPEVDQVVSRIGAAEVPTDPMSMEESDIIIRLHPPETWVSAQSKDALADSMKVAIQRVVGIDMEFTQPIEMRFNELITGVRADLAIKVFGHDLDVLFSKATDIKRLIENVEGAADITIEKVEGTPMIQVNYKRDVMARYGLSIDDVSKTVAAGVAGITTGNIYEADRKFDLVLRLNDDYQDAEGLGQVLIDLPEGGKIPLSELANVETIQTPAKISRDAAQRRIVVGVNVRNRDLESVVTDVQNILIKELDLPSGYTISYGGQFENLRRAKDRLIIAVPVALLLIFIMLYIAFKSVKESLLIFSAIPLAAVGGIVLLWIRDLPFSISAGVGFIALFGIAVLNGIVLIEHFKEMRHEGHDFTIDMIIRGAKSRLRPVLLTASAAALGFLPMAISHGAGAEVQRPLATVVIGGLITSTLLTLIVVPVFYLIMNKTAKLPRTTIMIILLLVGSSHVNAQLTMEEAIQASHELPALKAAHLEFEQAEAMRTTYSSFRLPEVYHAYDENNIAENGFPISVWGVSQSIALPGSNSGLKKQAQVNVEMASVMVEVKGRLVESIVQQAFLEVVYADNQVFILEGFKPMFDELVSTAELSVSLGESPGIEVLRAKNRKQQFLAEFDQARSRQTTALFQLAQLIDREVPSVVDSLVLLSPFEADIQTLEYRMLGFEKEKSIYAEKSARQELLPVLQAEVFQGSNNQVNAQSYSGFRIGMQLPLWPSTVKSKQRVAQLQQEIANARMEENAMNNDFHRIELERQISQLYSQIEQFRSTSLPLAKSIKSQLAIAKEAGEIDFFYYLNALEEAKVIELEHIEKCREYNLNVIYYNQVY